MRTPQVTDFKIELIKLLIKDWARNKINSTAAMYALGIIINEKNEQSDEFKQWVTEIVKNFKI